MSEQKDLAWINFIKRMNDMNNFVGHIPDNAKTMCGKYLYEMRKLSNNE